MAASAQFASTVAELTSLWAPRPRVDSFAWIRRHVKMPDGQPFDADAYPWTKAICAAWDDPAVRNIWLQMGSRLGKTAIAQSLLICGLANHPAGALFGSSTEHVASNIIAQKIYPMIDRCRPLDGQLPPEHRRSRHVVLLRHARMHVAWSGSVSTLADLEARYLHANEIDKWDRDVSSEADSLELFTERAKNVPDAKGIFESTPAERRSSRVEMGLLRSTNGRWHVPCPSCGRFQLLKLDRLRWEKDGTKSDPDTAAMTARYECEHCEAEIHDDDRPTMFRAGMYVPEGCEITTRGKLTGQQRRSGEDWGLQLSSLYSLKLTWGRIARAFVLASEATKRGQVGPLRNFVNSWLGETWEGKRVSRTWEEVGERLASNIPPGVVPLGHTFCAAGIDVQLDAFVYLVLSFAPDKSAHVVSYGYVHSVDELARVTWNAHYAHADGGQPVPVRLTLIDSGEGNRMEEVYRIAAAATKPGAWVFPSKGESKLSGHAYKLTPLEDIKSRNPHAARGLRGQQLVAINTNYWQSWLQAILDNGTARDEGGLSLPAQAIEDQQDLLEQFLNEIVTVNESVTGHDKQRWERVSRSIPVDYRDCVRYARCAAQIFTRGNFARIRRQVAEPVAATRSPPAPDKQRSRTTADAPQRPWLDRPGGWTTPPPR